MYDSPKILRPRDRVAIVAPASPFIAAELQVGLDIYKEYGLIPVLGPNVRNLKSMNVHAAPVQDRAEEINWAYSDPTIKAVIATCGGIGSAGLLPHLDYEMIARSGKVLVGMSDITALNTGLMSKAGLISISGQSPSIRLDKGKKIYDSDVESLRMTIELMMSDQSWGDKPFSFNPYIPRTVSPGRARGTVVGGNLDTFSRLIGTPYMSDMENTILFIEDVHKNGEVIAREFLHLKIAGMLDQVAGVVIGEFEDVGQKSDNKVPAIEDVIKEYFVDGAPCVYGYPFSHGPLTSPIPIGAMCEMDADTGEVVFDFSMKRR